MVQHQETGIAKKDVPDKIRPVQPAQPLWRCGQVADVESDLRIAKIQRAYKIIKRNNTTQALEQLKAESDSSEDVAALIKFLEKSERGIIK